MITKNQLIGISTFIVLGQIVTFVIWFYTNQNFYLYFLTASVISYILIGLLIKFKLR